MSSEIILVVADVLALGSARPADLSERGPAHERVGPRLLRDVDDELSVNLAAFNQLVSRHHVLEGEGPTIETRH